MLDNYDLKQIGISEKDFVKTCVMLQKRFEALGMNMQQANSCIYLIQTKGIRSVQKVISEKNVTK